MLVARHDDDDDDDDDDDALLASRCCIFLTAELHALPSWNFPS